MLMRRYEMPWRRAYEVYAAAVWASALLFFAVTGGLGLLPRQLALPLAAFCLAMGVLRLAQGVHTLVLREGQTVTYELERGPGGEWQAVNIRIVEEPTLN